VALLFIYEIDKRMEVRIEHELDQRRRAVDRPLQAEVSSP
jgi:hypothetical protein